MWCTKIHLVALSLCCCHFQSWGDHLRVSVVHASDAQTSDGAIDLQVVGGFEPYTYVWDNGASAEDLNGISAGQYCVTVTDALCGKASLCVTVESDCQAFLFFGLRYQWACSNQNNGSLEVALSNSGTAPYTFRWSNGSTTQTIENLAPGWYELTVTDATNCSQSGIFRVYEKRIEVNAQLEGACSPTGGVIDLSVTGHHTRWPFSYEWSNGATTEDLDGIAPGSYCVTVTDGEGCTASNCFALSSSFNAWVASVANNETCGNLCNGEINVEIPAREHATYQWSGPNGFSATSQDLVGLCNGNYYLTVVNGEGCRKTLGVRICCCSGGLLEPGEEAPPISVAVNTLTPIGYGNDLGAIDLAVSSGASTLYYHWTGPDDFVAFTQDIRKLEVGTYCVTLTDGCDSFNDCYEIVDCEHEEFGFNGAVVPACNGFEVGAVVLNVSGGTMPYQYQWDNGATTKDLFSLPSGQYCVTVTDENYCRLAQCFTVGIGQISQRWAACTFVTECSGQIILSNSYPIVYRTNALDCRYVDAFCTGTDTVIGERIFVGTTQNLEGCDLVTRNNRTGEECSRIRGTASTQLLSGYDEVNGCFYCLRVSYCDFGDYVIVADVVNRLGLGGSGGCVNCGGTLCGCWQVLTCDGVEFVRWCDPECDDQVKVCPLNFGSDGGWPETGHYETYTFDDVPEIGTIEVFIPDVGFDDAFLTDLLSAEGIATEVTQLKASSLPLSTSSTSIDPVSTELTGRGETTLGELLAIPNPFSRELTITHRAPVLTSERAVLKVLDITGSILEHEAVLLQEGQNHWHLDLGSYAAGIYFVVLRTSSGIHQTRIIKSK
ncbi:MAG: T9SS type A sorting domain-containing protein [Bacteroidota bacterium]